MFHFPRRNAKYHLEPEQPSHLHDPTLASPAEEVTTRSRTLAAPRNVRPGGGGEARGGGGEKLRLGGGTTARGLGWGHEPPRQPAVSRETTNNNIYCLLRAGDPHSIVAIYLSIL